jgi:hypothetical protein
MMHSVQFQVPNGAQTDPLSFRACILAIWQNTVFWPMPWTFVPESYDETMMGKAVIAAAEEALG